MPRWFWVAVIVLAVTQLLGLTALITLANYLEDE